ncbi:MULTISPECIES: putative urea ABC transporter substrate-binding protein [unclassified Pseudomonas]|uniref:putative urea ABC transporter substrate-binding protein n=1 Tax=unclassified Pseudomonas TaxID=196821 RepID=UPI00244D6E68|nr:MULTISPECIES: putative urea ABC transporter substrate-binding protein [unclassified Pseudomonas]MDG9928787.1 putative urea ABC transporter substrate-binding protein [Pseudomonas sp. GD04042]MDH0481856.1 putative urea ABC transporter substrate-binding protein [Pseudomonas sp. GD04015]MDH0603228.1 putative urea ABC transporter substrate-binding protein [Pseudomonas sp. GD03869]
MRKSLSSLIAAGLAATLSLSAQAAPKTDFSVCWTIYAGWMPWEYGATQGIVDKWAKKYGISIDVVQLNDYVESINQYTAGQFDGCTMTNMDALTIPAAGGVDSTALVIGDFSNGNDGIVIKGEKKTLGDLKGQNVNLVELSVSHYLLARGLERAGLSEKDLKVVNTSDADMVAAFATNDVQAVATWNPLLAEIEATPGVTKVFDSSQIPGEIIDLMVVNSETLKDNPALGKALTGAWYEIMAAMSADSAAGMTAREHMAKASGTDLAGYEAQLAATKMFYSAKDAVAFATSAKLPATMTKVAEFSFAHGLLGEGAQSAEAIGMAFAKGVTTGDKGNLKLRFDPTYMQMAADGAL